jgi:hypothetical protein
MGLGIEMNKKIEGTVVDKLAVWDASGASSVGDCILDAL